MITIKPTPIGIIDGENIDIEEIDELKNDFTEINYVSNKNTAKFTEMCSKLSFTKVIRYNITPNQSVIDMYLENKLKKDILENITILWMIKN